MMKLLIAAALLFATPALSAEFDPVIWAANDQACALGVFDGYVQTPENRVKVCTYLLAMERELSASGYCWVPNDHTWQPCKPD